MIGSPTQDGAKRSFQDRSVRRESSKREGQLQDSWTAAKPGEYSDVLRVIGHFLDQEGASEIEIVDQGAFLNAAWRDKRDSRQERRYHAFELDRLRVDARARRTGGAVTPGLSNEEILRALGREC